MAAETIVRRGDNRCLGYICAAGFWRTTVAAKKGRKWERAYLVGLGVGCAFGVGVVLFVKNSLPLDTFVPSVLLAAGGGFAIWAYGGNA